MLFYKTYGKSSVKYPFPLVFIHGFVGSHEDWEPVLSYVSKEYECIAIDLPAHGQSPYTQDVYTELEHGLQKWKAPILVGYSLGGRLSLQYGENHPEHVKGVIALSSHTGLASNELKEKRKEQDALWIHRLLTLSSEKFLSLWYAQDVFASLQKRPELLQHLLQIRTYNNCKELASILDQVSLAKQPLYTNSSYPLSFLYGEEDLSYVNLYAHFPTSQKKAISSAGHTIHLENPLDCAEAISFFAARYSLHAV
jgi:2-succinyl-6-hydroxy-2,4-cyclohexadiene-1-carboxylate synthase